MYLIQRIYFVFKIINNDVQYILTNAFYICVNISNMSTYICTWDNLKIYNKVLE